MIYIYIAYIFIYLFIHSHLYLFHEPPIFPPLKKTSWPLHPDGPLQVQELRGVQLAGIIRAADDQEALGI